MTRNKEKQKKNKIVYEQTRSKLNTFQLTQLPESCSVFDNNRDRMSCRL